MPHMRAVKTCDRCRHFKRRCDLLKPSCTRCQLAGVHCSFEVQTTGAGAPAPTTSSLAAAPQASSLSPGESIGDGAATGHGLISPSTSTEDPEPQRRTSSLSGIAHLNVGDDVAGGSALAVVSPEIPGQRVVRKRKRNCLSCLRCHRLKVKCDKELPCGRCKSSGNGRECYYTYNKGPNGGKFPCPTVPATASTGSSGTDVTKSTQATWHVSHEPRGASHWRDLMTKIGSLTSKESAPLATALENVATNACLANFTLPGNFPFGTPGASKYYARDAVVRLIESERPRCQTYIDTYVNLLDCVNPILDVPEFQKELDKFWEDTGAVSLCWMSQLLMVLGLGAFSTPEEPSIATELMMGAEACLMQTPFMFRPTFASLKAMALMVVAKQETSEVRDPAERASRRKLWLTILYLDIKISMPTGMPPLTRPGELSSLKDPNDLGEHNSLQQILAESLPSVLSVLVQVNNSSNDQIPYPDVLRYNAQIRALMSHAQRVLTHPLQRVTVDVYLRRCLMVLHRPFALHIDGPTMFPESYWSSLECSLAVLMHYRDLWFEDPYHRYDLVGRAFTMDFFSAALQASVHVLRKDAPLAGSAGIGCEIPPRQIILDTLKSCIEIWGGEQEKSVCWRTGYNVLTAIMALMPDED